MCVSIPRVCLASPQALEGIRSSGTGVTDGCEPPRGFWELNTGPFLEHPVLALRHSTGPLPSPSATCFHVFYCRFTFRVGECPGDMRRSVSRFLWVSGAEPKQAREPCAWVSTGLVMVMLTSVIPAWRRQRREPASPRLTRGAE